MAILCAITLQYFKMSKNVYTLITPYCGLPPVSTHHALSFAQPARSFPLPVCISKNLCFNLPRLPSVLCCCCVILLVQIYETNELLSSYLTFVRGYVVIFYIRKC